MFPLHDKRLKSNAILKIKLKFDEDNALWHETTAHNCGLGSFKEHEDYFFFRDSLFGVLYCVRFEDIVAIKLIEEKD